MAVRQQPIDSNAAALEFLARRIRTLEDTAANRAIPPGYHTRERDGIVYLVRESDGLWTPIGGGGSTPGPAGPAGAAGAPGADGAPGAAGATGPAGADAPSIVFVQAIPAAVWTIPHGLSRFPQVTIVDTAETVVEGDIVYLDDNNIQITFTAPFSGRAFLGG